MSLHEYPKKPGISRFVAPWDTSGWYFMAEHFAPGCRIYSNADITVTECPEILMGCDYIVTYDSATDGFDDKQEVDFFIEQTGEVYAALDADAPADFPTGFARTDLVVRTDAGDTYRLFMRPYARGAHVHLDAFSSPGRHFFVAFRPTETETEKPLPEAKRFSWRNGTRRAKHAGLCMTALHRRICPVMTAAATCGFARKRTTPSGTISACKAERGFRAPAKQADRMNCRWRWMFPRARRRSNLRV